MVTIVNYEKRQGTDGKEFILLHLQGDMEIAISALSGKPYATVKRCKIPATFDEFACKTMIGRTIPGSIIKVPVEEPYEFKIPHTNEIVELDYRYTYSATEASLTMEQTVFG